MDNALETAILLACESHQGQVDKAGRPYILHPLRLMVSCESTSEQIVAVLHDVVEDTSVTLERLRELGFGLEVVAAIDALTHKRSRAESRQRTALLVLCWLHHAHDCASAVCPMRG